ncbi:MAG TPA: efflux RND transporter periplasmic adaptor subunit [Bacteroidales bacterium]|nr:efflux RND transporter periplasmic adaptor subunit [Bacteroidales bacterium]
MKLKVLSIAIIILLSGGCRSRQVKVTTPDLTPVRVTQVSPEFVTLPVHSSGILLSSEEKRLSFKTGGIVSRIPVREGDKVKAGQLLASLNLSEINSQVSLASSAFDKAQRDNDRVRNLFSDSVATLEQMQNSTTALSMARSNLEIANFNLSHSTITAPSNGIILKQLVRENEMVTQGYPVFLFGTSGKSWKVKTGLADRDIVRINTGDSASIAFDAWPSVNFPAQVDLVGEMANQQTGTCDAELTISDNGYRFATGFVAKVEIFPTKKESYILVPVGSLIEADGQTAYLFAVSDSLKARKIKVKIVAVSGDRTAISGLPEDVKSIVTEGAAYLREGEKVKVVNNVSHNK